ncbi:MAG TPA: PLD nuclease N-terminal domain-containing protein [Rubricoccaceae bacterium]|jgi:uncharacterized membrane protein
MTPRLRAFPALALPLVAAVLSGCGPSNLVRGIRTPFAGPCWFIVVVLDLVAIVEVWKSTRSNQDKVLWTIGIVIFPFVGLIAYYFFGRR